MSSKRTFWSKLNHDDARMSIEMMDDAEIGRWFRGWLAGAGGKEYAQEKLAAFPLEMRTGFSAGRESFDDAERYSEKQRGRVNKRYHGSTTEAPGNTMVQSGTENPSVDLPTNSEQRTANIQQKTESNDPPLNPPKGRRFVSPTEAEWVAYCGEAWKDWHPECSAEAWAYYESKGWKIGTAPCKDWKAAARTSHGKAREWQRLQPMSGAPISPPAPRQEVKRPTWTIERDIRDEEGRLKTAQGERKEARDQRNRFSMGSAEYQRHNQGMREADVKILASETRLVELRNEMDKNKNGGE